MSFMIVTDRPLGLTSLGKIVEAGDPEALAQIPAGRLIPIDVAERLGITTEAEERAKADRTPDPWEVCPTCGSRLAPEHVQSVNASLGRQIPADEAEE